MIDPIIRAIYYTNLSDNLWIGLGDKEALKKALLAIDEILLSLDDNEIINFYENGENKEPIIQILTRMLNGKNKEPIIQALAKILMNND